MPDLQRTPPLSWLRSDPECMLGLRGARFTRVHSFVAAVFALAVTAAWFGGLALLPSRFESFVAFFCKRGPTPYAIVFAAAWCAVQLVMKNRKIALQRKALTRRIIPEAHDFVLSTATVDQVTAGIFKAVDDPKQFVLFNRIAVALANLRNLGRVTDIDEILRSQADHDESIMESSYSLLRGLIWAIPVLGFIGTVLGLSAAIGGFGDVLGTAGDMSEVTASLKGVTAGLSTAFDTTLLALVSALVLQIWVTFSHKSEEEFLDQCTEYCQLNIVNRLRIMPFEADDTTTH